MRLQSLYISDYKNLKKFKLDFDGQSFIDVFVGKNGTGKSNLFEALIEIFRHLYEFDNRRGRPIIGFQYAIKYEINGAATEIEWKDDILKIGGIAKKRIAATPLPDNVLIYYSGHNTHVDESSTNFQLMLKRHFRGGRPVAFHHFMYFDRAYKKLLITIFLAQPFDENLRSIVREKLCIMSIDVEFIITLKRPYIVRRNFKVDRADDITLYWGIQGQARDFLRRLSTCDNPVIEEKSGYRKSGYITDEYKPYYKYYINIEKFQKEFQYESVDKLIEMFNAVKVIDIIDDIKLMVTLNNKQKQDIKHFSDGQFQSIYLYALLESFQDRNCVTLLDEPDSFLHPEWQYEFLKQTKLISASATRNNHVLLSSHSPSTIAAIDQERIVNFEIDNDQVKAGSADKNRIIGDLSAGLMTYNENEIIMSINVYLKNTTQPVLFTEGISDECILDIAWQKLYGAETRPFCIHSAFDRIFLRNMFSRDDLKQTCPRRALFALFDFDEAFDDWNGLKMESFEISDPFIGLTKKLKDVCHYAMLLPVPRIDALKKQVLNKDDKPWGKGSESHLTIELLFFKDGIASSWYEKKEISGGGEIVEFAGDKVKFARECVPTFAKDDFEIFRPMFDFIKGKC